MSTDALDRATRTEHGALCTNSNETLPRNSRLIRERPCEPTTTKSGCHTPHVSRIISAGLPHRACVETVHCGKYERSRPAACCASNSAAARFDLQDGLQSAFSVSEV